jgi:hypothetical protein
VADEVERVLDTTCAPQRRRVERDTKLFVAEQSCLLGQRDGAFDEQPVEVGLDQAPAEVRQRTLGEGRFAGAKAAQDELPPRIQCGVLHGHGVGRSVVGLHQRHGRQQRGGNDGRPSSFSVSYKAPKAC